ncbi:unnamed protein product [Paramecium primaurelia]|uniref:Transmembrane protein n=1 Tax=Paramecium primaurelia TaxID=5886 RepID=A0A8S1N7N2_PARPR|nr:unnamed protein product [Paramecium primaurelia]
MKIQLKCQNFKQYYFSLGVFQLFYSTLHQQLFSTLLQFPIYNFDSLFEIINRISALGSLIFLVQILLKLLSITTSKIKDKQKWKYFFQDTKTEFWQLITNHFKFIELYSIIQLQLNSQGILKHNQFYFQSKLLCRQIILLINTGSFLIYSLELNDEQYLLYGWLHISLFCFLMGSTLIIEILQQGQKAYYIHLKKIQTQEKINRESYSENPLQKFVEVKNLDMKK